MLPFVPSTCYWNGIALGIPNPLNGNPFSAVDTIDVFRMNSKSCRIIRFSVSAAVPCPWPLGPKNSLENNVARVSEVMVAVGEAQKGYRKQGHREKQGAA
jgi:hypothetical protein